MQTFLFTDIEGSTRLWEEYPDEMPAALARHDEILTEAVRSKNGQVVKTTGDGMLARFETPLDSVLAAITAQTALQSERWGRTGPVLIRISVHSGESENRGSDYFGPTVNRAARIMAAAHGGQILVSGTVAAAVSGLLPSGVGLRDLATHRLKDLTEPEHLFQLLHPDLPGEFPPPVTLDSRAHNLPLQNTAFFGRESEISTVTSMLRSPGTKLVTVTGPGGAGKTRLALQVAAELLEDFRDGAFFVDLSAERDPEAAYEAVVRSLSLAGSGSGGPMQVLRVRLRDKELLLILDNFEQVMSAAPGVAELLAQCPGLKVIVTSREMLRLRAERVFPVPPLSLPHPRRPAAEIAASEAVQLFAERAAAVQPDFGVTDENASLIAEICLRLDGLPLAIELAAARLNLFSPADLLERLRTRLDVLGAGGRDLPDRQRTLWGAIGWSYELLEPADCEVFELMSVFSRSRLESIEAVAADLGIGSVLESLAALVDKSLIKSEEFAGSRRFSMLQMIKEYAEQLLAERPEDNERVRRAHAIYFSGFAQQLKERLAGTEREAALVEVEAEIGNLRAAWRYWVSRGDLAKLFGLIDALWVLHEAKGWYHAAIELATDTLDVLGRSEPSEENAAEELALRTSLARAVMAVRGYGPEVEAAFKNVLDMSKANAPAAQRYPVLRALATYYMNLTEFEKAIEIGFQLVELGERENDASVVAEGNYVLGAGLAFSGQVESGLNHLERAIQLRLPRAQGANRYRLGPSTGVVARVASGLLLWQGGEVEPGIERVGSALSVAREIDHPYSVAYALHHLAFLALGRGRVEEALAYATELTSVATANDYLVWKTLATVVEGVARTALGETRRGLDLTEVGVELYQGLSTPPIFWPLVLGLRAAAHGLGGNRARALELIDEAIAAGGTDQIIDPDLLLLKGDFLMLPPAADSTRAEAAYRQSIMNASSRGQRLIELKARNRLVALLRSESRHPDGSEDLLALYATFTSGFDEADLVRAKELLGEQSQSLNVGRVLPDDW